MRLLPWPKWSLTEFTGPALHRPWGLITTMQTWIIFIIQSTFCHVLCSRRWREEQLIPWGANNVFRRWRWRATESSAWTTTALTQLFNLSGGGGGSSGLVLQSRWDIPPDQTTWCQECLKKFSKEDATLPSPCHLHHPPPGTHFHQQKRKDSSKVWVMKSDDEEDWKDPAFSSLHIILRERTFCLHSLVLGLLRCHPVLYFTLLNSLSSELLLTDDDYIESTRQPN